MHAADFSTRRSSEHPEGAPKGGVTAKDRQLGDFFARRSRERWAEDAPDGYRLVRVPRLVVPAHQVVVELHDETFVAGSKDIAVTLSGYGDTPEAAIREFERLLFSSALNAALTPEADDHDAWLGQFTADDLLELTCPEPIEKSAPAVTEPCGALRLWREELHSGFRGQDPKRPSTWRTNDALFRAATLEAHGLDAQAAGLEITAAGYFTAAAVEIAEATAERAA